MARANDGGQTLPAPLNVPVNKKPSPPASAMPMPKVPGTVDSATKLPASTGKGKGK